MPQEHEAIRQEMDETRCSLTDKISLLEQQVVDTVHEASNGVKETVEAVKEAVQDTVQSVKTTMGETVDTVKETFSVSCQVEKHPWMMMAGGIGVGFFAGYLLNAPEAPASPKADSPAPPPRRSSNGSHREPLVAPATFADEPQPSTNGLDSGVAQLTKIFESEISQLKGLAIGTLVGVVRDMVVDTVPEMMRNPLHEIFNDYTEKFGGHAIPGRIFATGGGAQADVDNDRPSQSASFAHPRRTAPFPK